MRQEKVLPYGLKPIPKETQDQYEFITWEQLKEKINENLPEGMVAAWDFTGGGCSRIWVGFEGPNGENQSYIGIIDSDVPSVNQYQQEVNINEFWIVICNAEDGEDYWQEELSNHVHLHSPATPKWGDASWKVSHKSELIEDDESHNVEVLIKNVLEIVEAFDPEVIQPYPED